MTSALAARPTASTMPPPRRKPAVQRRTKMPLSMRLLVSIIGMSAILSTTVVAGDAGAFGGNINNGSDNNDDNRSSSSSIITTEVGDTDDISTGMVNLTTKMEPAILNIDTNYDLSSHHFSWLFYLYTRVVTIYNILIDIEVIT